MMLNQETILYTAGLVIAGLPFVALNVFGACALFEYRLRERTMSRLMNLTIMGGLLAAVLMLGLMVFDGDGNFHKAIKVGSWVTLEEPTVTPDGHREVEAVYHFSFVLLFDLLSLPFVIMTFVLCGTIGAFASRYLHREPGFHRFYFLYAMFVAGMVTSALAGTIEMLFTGWELVGLSSALLVAFFQERTMPVRNGLRVWCVYRIADVAFLAATIILHHLRSEGNFDALLGTGPWPGNYANLRHSTALLVGLLLLVAAAGKSGLVPFSGWLPRAMEGPTPSSAVFYGALSVHLGAYLLLRVSPMIAMSPWLGAAVVLVGLTTALFASLTARVQTDIKSALSFASLTQVGIIVAEIGLGLHWIALAHLIGHACLRTLQFVRAPNLLQDYHAMENAIGARLPRSSASLLQLTWFYRFGLERGYLDAWLTDYIAHPVLRLFRWCDAMERRWTALLSGRTTRISDTPRVAGEALEEVA